MQPQHFLAFDLGASSGRALAGRLHEHRLEVRELLRFDNHMVSVRGRLHWNLLHLLQQIKQGIASCAREITDQPASLGIDTWGVDFGLLAADGGLLGLPVAYRDSRTAGAMDGFLRLVPRARVYQLTGIQLMPINTLFQLYAMVRDRSPLLAIASDLLMMPDLLGYLLTGEKRAELTISTTSQLYNPTANAWDRELLAALGLTSSLFSEIISPGTEVGPLDAEIARETGLAQVPVIATASHDTAAAVAAVPAEGKDWAYISSGTWSLMGVESEHPIINDESRQMNFSNEGGVGGTFRVLKNIVGLWLLQQCRQAWASDSAYTYPELTAMAASSDFPSVVEPDHSSFLSPGDMPAAIISFCQATQQQLPESPADFARCILVSLALKYRLVLEQLRRVYPHPINRIHVIGGGSQNEFLCQLTADVCGVPVAAGPVEATAVGNILVQAMGVGAVGSPSRIRAIVRESFPVTRYDPRDDRDWDQDYARFAAIHAHCMA